MSHFDIVKDITYLLSKIEDLQRRADSFCLQNIIPRTLVHEVETKTSEWRKIVVEAFDKYFIKQANIKVLDNAKKGL